MVELSEHLLRAGMQQVQTYIQSGNVVYRSQLKRVVPLNERIRQVILEKFGYEVPVLTYSQLEWQLIIQQNPFVAAKGIDHKCLHVTFLDDVPSKENVAKLLNVQFLPDEFVYCEKVIYLYTPGGYGETKLSNKFFESKLNVNATTRNWKTTLQLLQMTYEIP